MHTHMHVAMASWLVRKKSRSIVIGCYCILLLVVVVLRMLLLLYCMFVIIVLCLLYHCSVFAVSIVLKTSLLTDAVFPSNSLNHVMLLRHIYS